MEKKHISIIGTCVSRNLFNSTLLKNIFEIDQYICQVCEFALFDSGLNIKKEDIYKANIPEFTARCFNYELNKTAIDELKKKRSEYILIDLHNISYSIYEASIDNFKNFVYTQSTGHDLFNYLPYLNRVNNLKELKVKEIKFVDFDEKIIKNGLIKLSEFLKENYEEDKIIIHIPKRVKLYSDINGNIFSFDKANIEKDTLYDSIVFKYSNFLISLLPNCKVFYNTNNTVAKLIEGNINNNINMPQSDHFSDYDNFCAAKNLIKCIGINSNLNNDSIIEPINVELTNLSNNVLKNLIIINRYSEFIVNLNTYFDKISNYNDFIFIFSVKDEASLYIKYFRNKTNLGISANIGYRQSYIAVVDKSRNFIYEESSNNKLSYNYRVKCEMKDSSFNDVSILIKSAGFNCGNISEININGGDNLSLNKRGLNIIILNAKTLDIVDRVNCDTHNDRQLLIESDYLKNIKIKI